MDQMNVEFNVTYLTFSGHVELHRFRYLYFLVMFIVYVLILCSNSIILCIIWVHKSLHEPMYIFIAALLLNSILFSTNIYPKLLIDFLSDEQVITHSHCVFQFFAYYSLGGSEFLLLSAMAYDRYVSICKPLQYPNIMRKTTVSVLLLLAWLLPALQVMPTVAMSNDLQICRFNLTGIFCNNAIYKLYCVTPRTLSIYGVFNLLNIALLPMLFILFTYTRILIISYRSGRDVRKKAAQTCFPHLLALISTSSLCSYDVIIARLQVYFPSTARLIMTLQLIIYHPLFNPLIYGVKMKEISKHLKKLLCEGKLKEYAKTEVNECVSDGWTCPSKKLVPRFIGPFEIEVVINPCITEPRLSCSLPAHPTFKVSQVKLVQESSSTKTFFTASCATSDPG
ncbi:olfactory receptor 11A1-like [Acanthochromis polyacanthus]|uniref:olfactory receptor 11A1-like n=1 Tax=Acanthochromis polyacanthus TaxID=80966 RepID=UPI002234CB28|nr:olfactory receptor 11A1-like [Acanthochromis polyacanthus]